MVIVQLAWCLLCRKGNGLGRYFTFFVLFLVTICTVGCSVNTESTSQGITQNNTDIIGTVSSTYTSVGEYDVFDNPVDSFHIQFISSDGRVYNFEVSEELYSSIEEGENIVIHYTENLEDGVPYSSSYRIGINEVKRE